MSSYTQTSSYLPFVHITDPRWGQTRVVPTQEKKSEVKITTPVQLNKNISNVKNAISKSAADHLTDDFVRLSPTQRWNTQFLNAKKSAEPLFTKPQDNHNPPPIVNKPTPSPNIQPEVQQPLHHPTVNIEEELTAQNLYKTELCRSFEEMGTCRYGSKCQFAHGISDLRPVLRHPKYKTEVCKTFHTIGTCPYGKRCRFIHIPPSQRLPGDKEASADTTRNFINNNNVNNNDESVPEAPDPSPLPQVSALPIPPISALSVPAPTYSGFSTPIMSLEPKIEEKSDEALNPIDHQADQRNNMALPELSEKLEQLIESLNLNQSWEDSVEEEKKPDLCSKKDSERRLSIFQRICSDQPISV